MSQRVTADACLRSIQVFELQNTLLCSCKHVIFGDVHAGRPACLATHGMAGMIPKGRVEVVEVATYFPSGSFVNAFRWVAGVHRFDCWLYNVSDISKCRKRDLFISNVGFFPSS